MLNIKFFRLKALVILGLSVPFSFLFADQIILDYNLSPYSSSNNFIFVQNQLLEFQNQYKDDKYNSLVKANADEYFRPTYNYLNGPYYFSDSFGRRFLRAGLRWVELQAVWGSLSCMAIVVQHEVFGHGYRLRDLGSQKVELNRYKIQFTIDKWGFRHKVAYTSFFSNPETYTLSDDLLMSIGGMEANSIFAHNMVMLWLNKGEIDGRQAILWNYAYLDQIKYILGTALYNSQKFAALANSGHDVFNYVYTLNSIYPSFEPIKDQLYTLRNRAILAYVCNPFTYLAAYAEWSYILFNSAVPMSGISLKGIRFLPSYRLGLTPFGSEDIFEVFGWANGIAPFYSYCKVGEFSANQYVGWGFETQKLLLTAFGDFGIKIDLWHQPRMLERVLSHHLSEIDRHDYIEDILHFLYVNTGYTHQELYQKYLGGALSIIFQKALLNNLNQNIWVQLGYKTKGYLPGETYRQAPLVKIGLQTLF